MPTTYTQRVEPSATSFTKRTEPTGGYGFATYGNTAYGDTPKTSFTSRAEPSATSYTKRIEP